MAGVSFAFAAHVLPITHKKEKKGTEREGDRGKGRERRSGGALWLHVVPFRAGETVLENRSVIRRIPLVW